MKKYITILLSFILFASCLPTVSAEGFDENIVGYWKFDDGAVHDETGKWEDGAVGSDVTVFENGVSGSALMFKKTDLTHNPENYADLGVVPKSVAGGNEITVSAWIYPTGFTYYQTIFSLVDDESGNLVFALEFVNGTLQLTALNARYSTCAVTGVPQSKWSHIVLSLKMNQNAWQTEIFVNGESKGSSSGWGIFHGSLSSAWHAYAGKQQVSKNDPSTHDFNGAIDELRLYNVAAKLSDVNEIYNIYRPNCTLEKDSISMSTYIYPNLNDDTVRVRFDGEIEKLDTSDITVVSIPDGLKLSGVSIVDETSADIKFGGTAKNPITSEEKIIFEVAGGCIKGKASKSLPIEAKIIPSDTANIYPNLSVNGNGVTISGKLQNATDSTLSTAEVLIGMYKDGYMIDCKTVKITDFGKYGLYDFSETFEDTEDFSAADCTYKVFVWDSAYSPENAVGGKILGKSAVLSAN